MTGLPVRFDDAIVRVAGTARLRRAAIAILASALGAVDPQVATRRALRLVGRRLVVAGRPYTLARDARVVVVGAGKAGAPMAQAVEDVLGDRITTGAVIVKRGYTAPLRKIALREAGHPVPDAAGEAAARELLDTVTGLGPRDLVICLISGGGSALLPAPHDGVTLDDMIRTTDLLLRSGAAIGEINTVRKHLSRVAGGRLAVAASPARVVALVVSDIVGTPLDAIASGPTVPDSTTYADALGVLDAYGLTDRVPRAVRDVLRRGAAGELPETPKPGDPAFRRTHVAVVADNATAARAAVAKARRLGFHARLLSTYIEGEAREVGVALAGIARQIAATDDPVRRPACLVAGGETTVTVRGTGRGGRNQELALAAARTLDGIPGTLLVSFATDGTDGPTDAAGAVADGTTLSRARALGLDAAAHLANNDAYTFFDALGDLIRTGPTNTNVTDLMLILSS
ncbi:MAG TPA: glycerate kinase [bacterium]|nr:glycerate kinase [bacterium]